MFSFSDYMRDGGPTGHPLVRQMEGDFEKAISWIGLEELKELMGRVNQLFFDWAGYDVKNTLNSRKTSIQKAIETTRSLFEFTSTAAQNVSSPLKGERIRKRTYTPEQKAKQAAARKKRYHNDSDFREKIKAVQNLRYANMTSDQRAKKYMNEKARKAAKTKEQQAADKARYAAAAKAKRDARTSVQKAELKARRIAASQAKQSAETINRQNPEIAMTRAVAYMNVSDDVNAKKRPRNEGGGK